jgi:ubiquinone/menaquinone biosynthesis C-methylase UbiE
LRPKESGPKDSDTWASGELDEPYVGRWSRLVAREFLAWLSIPVNKRWLDVGCGTGALSETILHDTSPRTVTGVDPSRTYISFARKRIRADNTSFNVGSAESLESLDGTFDVGVSGLALNFVPRPEVAVAEMGRVTMPGGIVAAYVWDYAGKMELMRYFWDSAVSLNIDAFKLDDGTIRLIARAWAARGLKEKKKG